MPVNKFVLVQTFIKFKALEILPTNKDFFAFSKRRNQPPRNVLQESCYVSVVETLELY